MKSPWPVLAALPLLSVEGVAATWGNGCPAGESNFFRCSEPKVMALCGQKDGSGLHLVLDGLNLGVGAAFYFRQSREGPMTVYLVSFTDNGRRYQLFDHYQGNVSPPIDQQGLVISKAQGPKRQLDCQQGYNRLESLADKLPEAVTASPAP
ncbi:hypothetical protein [Gallaecimonas mangrovi]|uniref:hypothetical protein n=1 Tax=Gallaecimonas mangrovi TaxID=2291597 RepID=UPI000E20BCA6|nr:hypothetical protein [Gallaecimonas mangrovi]